MEHGETARERQANPKTALPAVYASVASSEKLERLRKQLAAHAHSVVCDGNGEGLMADVEGNADGATIWRVRRSIVQQVSDDLNQSCAISNDDAYITREVERKVVLVLLEERLGLQCEELIFAFVAYQ